MKIKQFIRARMADRRQVELLPSPPRLALLANRSALALVTSILLLQMPARAETLPEAPALAVLDFEYQDTSGEVRDQSAEHEIRLARFMASLRNDLEKSPEFRVVEISCRPGPCSLQSSGADHILEQARRGGADLLVFGAIQKMSTLVQLGNLHVVDVRRNKPVLERILTFRGDTDEAWRRAEEFVVKVLQRDVKFDQR